MILVRCTFRLPVTKRLLHPARLQLFAFLVLVCWFTFVSFALFPRFALRLYVRSRALRCVLFRCTVYVAFIFVTFHVWFALFSRCVYVVVYSADPRLRSFLYDLRCVHSPLLLLNVIRFAVALDAFLRFPHLRVAVFTFHAFVYVFYGYTGPGWLRFAFSYCLRF